MNLRYLEIVFLGLVAVASLTGAGALCNEHVAFWLCAFFCIVGVVSMIGMVIVSLEAGQGRRITTRRKS